MTDHIAATGKMAPLRIQRRRTRGWRMPANTVSVSRPGEFGNAWRVQEIPELGGGRQFVVTPGEFTNPNYRFPDKRSATFACVKLFERDLRHPLRHTRTHTQPA